MEIRDIKEARQRILYEYMKLIGVGIVIDQKKICSDLHSIYEKPYPGQSFHDSTGRRKLSRDIQAINRSPYYDHLIVSSPGIKGVCIQPKTIGSDFVTKKEMQCLRQLKGVHEMRRSSKPQNQLRMEGV
jgi:hypothetical protein